MGRQQACNQAISFDLTDASILRLISYHVFCLRGNHLQLIDDELLTLLHLQLQVDQVDLEKAQLITNVFDSGGSASV